MQHRRSRRLGKKVLAVTLAVVTALAAVGYQADRLSADPLQEKDCEPIAAENPTGAVIRIGEQQQTRLRVKFSAQIPSRQINWKQKGGTINDASCLNRTVVYGIAQIRNEEDVRNALIFARENKLKVSIAGVRHSMGGHAFFKNALVLDMTQFNRISLDADQKVITAQSGATWHDIQDYLHPKYAVKAMQSTDIFTVGGSISVNAHGMDHQAGSVGSTIRSMRIMRPDGTIALVSPNQNRELFDLIIGGYGLFGIILDAEIEVTDNAVYQTERQIIGYTDFPQIFENEIATNKDLGLFYGHLSTSPGSLLDEMILYQYTKADLADAEIPPLGKVSATRLRRLVLNFSKLGDIPMRIKWAAEKYIEPRMETCTVIPRTQAMSAGEACFVSRNDPMHDSVAYLRNDLKNETDILHEYFIPRDQFVPFIDGLRAMVREEKVNLLNASVRVIHPEDNFLNYAPTEMFSIVLYINQPTTPEGNEKMVRVTRKLVDLTLQVNGRFFLPYQLHYTPEQLTRSYPEIMEFFELKRVYDPEGLLTNGFYEKYSQ